MFESSHQEGKKNNFFVFFFQIIINAQLRCHFKAPLEKNILVAAPPKKLKTIFLFHKLFNNISSFFTDFP